MTSFICWTMIAFLFSSVYYVLQLPADDAGGGNGLGDGEGSREVHARGAHWISW